MSLLDRVTRLMQAADRLGPVWHEVIADEAPAPALFYECTPEGMTSNVGTAWEALTGRPAATALGNGWLDAVAAEDRARVAAAWRNAVRRGEFEETFRLGGTLVLSRAWRTRSGALAGIALPLPRKSFVWMGEHVSDGAGEVGPAAVVVPRLVAIK